MTNRSTSLVDIETWGKQEARLRKQFGTAQKQQNREQARREKERHITNRLDEVELKNIVLNELLQEIKTVLEQTLPVNDTISFDSLRNHDTFPEFIPPQELTIPKTPPDKEKYREMVKTPTLLEKTLGLKDRYEKEREAATAQYQAAYKAYKAAELERQQKLQKLKEHFEICKQSFLKQQEQRNKQVDEFELQYRRGTTGAVNSYNLMVLERSEYPADFPQKFRLAYSPRTKELAINYELPSQGVIPKIAEYKYVKTRDAIEEKYRKPTDIKDLYLDLIAAITLRTIHEVFEADQGNVLASVIFNGYVHGVDPATGNDTNLYLVSVCADKESFMKINLSRVDKQKCLQSLKGQVSAQPLDLKTVKPLIDFEDRRFVGTGEPLRRVERRMNLMDLDPLEFERIICVLLQKMGWQTQLTQRSHDGGVDVVALNPEPIVGGKVIIQAKRYKNTVGVSAVRDLFGTMMSEGASKGILVTTSSYGPDAYTFVKNKPVELVDGGLLLSLLEERAAIKACIIVPVK